MFTPECDVYPSYYRTSTPHNDDLKTSLKNNNQATEPYWYLIRGLWCKLNIADPPPDTPLYHPSRDRVKQINIIL